MADQSGPPDAVIISGDIAWSGSVADYGYALSFLTEMRTAWNKIHIIVAPGNHDLTLDTSVSDDDRQDSYIQFIKNLYPGNWKDYYPFLELAGSALTKRERLIGFHQFEVADEGRISILSLNSAAAITATTKNIPIHIRKDVFDLIEERIGKTSRTLTNTQEELRLLVVHHHLLPFYEINWKTTTDLHAAPGKPDGTVVANSAELQSWLAANKFRIVLHGHKHIPHGREDVLYRRQNSARPLIIIGAGSCGVFAKERNTEALSYNQLKITRLSNARWSMHVETRGLADKGPDKAYQLREPYQFDLGEPPTTAPTTFWAEGMKDCHRTISEQIQPGRLYYNFVSSVERSTYEYPSTAAVPENIVNRSFRALHPEWNPDKGWAHPDIQRALDSVAGHYQFQHGIRLFADGRQGTTTLSTGQDLQQVPIRQAIKKIASRSSRAYIGLYSPTTDAASTSMMPTMTGIQFIKDNEYLDLVITFRKIELSAWWVVNMLEASRLLAWAASAAGSLKPRRVTFFASMAEWKESPSLTVIPLIDALEDVPLSKLTNVLLKVIRSESSGIIDLRTWLEDKLTFTNNDNIDPSGLERLSSLIEGMKDSPSHADALIAKLSEPIRNAASSLRASLKRKEEDERNHDVSSAKKKIDEAIAVLKIT